MAESSQGFGPMLERARRGDQQALAELAQTYEADVRIMAHVHLGRALRPYLDSVDLVQSVHRSLLIGLRQDKFDISSPEKLLRLALTIVRRKVARQWRRMQRQQRLPADAAGSTDLPGFLTALSAPHADPAAEAQINDAVQRLCRTLDEPGRQIMELRLQGYSTVEVARQLGLDADVLRVRLSRLRKRLREDGILTEWL
jgi:RNA polymerase sigma-70 factor (ECF subfamily)